MRSPAQMPTVVTVTVTGAERKPLGCRATDAAEALTPPTEHGTSDVTVTEGETALTWIEPSRARPVMTFSIGPLASAVCVTYVDVQVSDAPGASVPAVHDGVDAPASSWLLMPTPVRSTLPTFVIVAVYVIVSPTASNVVGLATRATLIAGAGRKLTV